MCIRDRALDAAWTVVPGTYTSNLNPIYSWIVTQALADELAGEINSIELKTSFFKIQGGIRFYF